MLVLFQFSFRHSDSVFMKPGGRRTVVGHIIVRRITNQKNGITKAQSELFRFQELHRFITSPHPSLTTFLKRSCIRYEREVETIKMRS